MSSDAYERILAALDALAELGARTFVVASRGIALAEGERP